MEGNGRKASKARNDHSPKKKKVTKKCKLIGLMKLSDFSVILCFVQLFLQYPPSDVVTWSLLVQEFCCFFAHSMHYYVAIEIIFVN